MKTGTQTSTIKIQYNTTNDLTGSPLSFGNTQPINHAFSQMKREIYVRPNESSPFTPLSQILAASANAITDDMASTSAVSDLTLDWTLDSYILFTGTPAANNTLQLSGYSIEIL